MYVFDQEKVMKKNIGISVDTVEKCKALSKYLKSIGQEWRTGMPYDDVNPDWLYKENTVYLPFVGALYDKKLIKKLQVVTFDSVLVGLSTTGIYKINTKAEMEAQGKIPETVNTLFGGRVIIGNAYDGYKLTFQNASNGIPKLLSKIKVNSVEDFYFFKMVCYTLGFTPDIENKTISEDEKVKVTNAFIKLCKELKLEPSLKKLDFKSNIAKYGNIELNIYDCIVLANDAIKYDQPIILTKIYSNFTISNAEKGDAIIRDGKLIGVVDFKTQECTSIDAVVKALTTKDNNNRSYKESFTPQIRSKESSIKNLSDNLLKEYQVLRDMQMKYDASPMLPDGMIISGTDVIWYTNFLYIYPPKNKFDIKEIPLGRFQITFSLNKTDVKFKNLTRLVNGLKNGMHAPHVFSEGNACLGSFAVPIIEALGQLDLERFKALCLMLLTLVNDTKGDAAGLAWPAWLDHKDERLCKDCKKALVDEDGLCSECSGKTPKCDHCGKRHESVKRIDEYKGMLCIECVTLLCNACPVCSEKKMKTDTTCSTCSGTHKQCPSCKKFVRNEHYVIKENMCHNCIGKEKK
jgi:hypothetical protein